MELNPNPTMTKTEARQLSNVLNQTIFRDERQISGETILTDRQRMVGELAIAQLDQASSKETVVMDLEGNELEDVLKIARLALEDPRGIMFGLISPEPGFDETFRYDERGDALRSLAVTADFVEMVQPWRR